MRSIAVERPARANSSGVSSSPCHSPRHRLPAGVVGGLQLLDRHVLAGVAVLLGDVVVELDDRQAVALGDRLRPSGRARRSGLAYTASSASAARYSASSRAWAWPVSDSSGSAAPEPSSRRTGRAWRISSSSIDRVDNQAMRPSARRSSPPSARPASRPRCSTRCCAPASTSSGSTSATARSTSTSSGCARVRAAAERVGQVVAVLADLPGPKVRAGRFPEGGRRCCVGQASVRARRRRRRDSTARRDRASTTRRCSTTSHVGDKVVRRRRRASRLRVDASTTTAVTCSVRVTGGHDPGSARACTCPSERLPADARRPTRTWCWPQAMAAEGVDFLGRVVRAPCRRPARGPRGDRAVAPRSSSPRSRRWRRRRPRRHRRASRRRDGRPRRPRHRVPARGRAAPPEADHPPLRRGRRAGDHRHADAGEHDHTRRRRRVPRSATSPTPCSTGRTR